jgi:copper chaperone CopZ
MGIFGKKTATLTLEVPDMHCENCERRVKVILESVPGVASVTPNAKKGNVVVGLDASAPAAEQTIRDELAAGGYPAAGSSPAT